MAYSSYVYLLLFLLGTFVIYTILPKKLEWVVLLLSSILFYFATSGKLILFILISAMTVFGGALFISRTDSRFADLKGGLERDERKRLKKRLQRRKKLICYTTVLLNFGLLIYFKYSGLLAETANGVLNVLGLGQPFQIKKIIMPLGISFYTLQAASYLIDVYRGKYKASRNPVKVILYLIFFPTVVEGPISRFDEVGDQLYYGHKLSYKNVTFGLQLIFWGLFKKLVIADRADILVKNVFSNYSQYSGIIIILSGLLYTIQIYAEFSGCMDIAVGSAKMFGIDLPQNFRQPFFSTSVNEFWRRWHITLGAWLRDYVFYGASLSGWYKKFTALIRKHLPEGAVRLLLPLPVLFLVWFGNGLWHGADIKYIMYGMYYFFITCMGMFFEVPFAKISSKLRIDTKSRGYRIFQVIRTFILVNIGMLMFRADSLNAAWQMFLSAFKGINLSVFTDGSLLSLGIDICDWSIIIFSVILMLTVDILKEKGVSVRETVSGYNIFIRWGVYIAAVVLVVVFGAYGANYNPVAFIYAAF